MIHELGAVLRDVLKKDAGLFVWTLVLMIVSSLLQGVTILTLIPILGILNIGGASTDATLPFGLSLAAAKLNEQPLLIRLILVLGFFFVIMLVQAAAHRKMRVQCMQLASNFTADMREEYYNCLMDTPWESYITGSQARHMDAMVNEIPRLTTTVNYFLCMLTNIATALVELAVAFAMSVPLSIFVICAGGIFFIFFRPFTKRSKVIGNRLTAQYDKFTAEMKTQLAGFKEIRSYGIEEEEAKRFDMASRDLEHTMVMSADNVARPRMLSTIGEAVLISVIFFGAVYFLEIETSHLVIVLYVFMRIWPLLPSTQEYIMGIRETLPAYRVMEDVRRRSSGMRSDERKSTDGEFGAALPEGIALTFDRVSFSYAGASENALEDVTFEIKKNTITALTGPSGAGKSTAVDLILGFLSPGSGEVKIAVTKDKICYVPQNPMILNAGVRENIARFHPGISDDKIIRALKKSGAWDFLVRKADGEVLPLDLRMGDDGAMFSGGEVQRIVLARALAGDPELLILDEATSALDFENEKLIADVLARLRDHVTVILIAHRVSTIQTADDILVIADGHLSESGTADELLSDPDSYLRRMKDG